MQEIRRAILSVFDKTGIVDLARVLVNNNVELLSTGGTGRALTEAGIAFTEVKEFTRSPEMLGGRVKTLHPMIHGGLLFKRDDPEQVKEAEAHGVKPIDLVVVNLYPFEETIARPGVTLEDAVENIDIGGPCMIRASAKNFQAVTVVTDPADYPELIETIQSEGSVPFGIRKSLAIKAFGHTHHYDGAIEAYLKSI